MTIAIMQPYFLPYIGYFQLISAVNKFIVYDDVNYIKGGWINRNRLLVNGAAQMFTVPIRDASPNRLICELDVIDKPIWRDKFLKTVSQAYSRSPEFKNVFPLLEKIVRHPAINLSEYLVNSLLEVCGYLNISTQLVRSSRCYGNANLKSQERVIDICLRENAARYINSIGGSDLYDKSDFKKKGVELTFLRPRLTEYRQGKSPFIPWLSIVDVLMFNDRNKVAAMMGETDFL